MRTLWAVQRVPSAHVRTSQGSPLTPNESATRAPNATLPSAVALSRNRRRDEAMVSSLLGSRLVIELSAAEPGTQEPKVSTIPIGVLDRGRADDYPNASVNAFRCCTLPSIVSLTPASSSIDARRFVTIWPSC